MPKREYRIVFPGDPEYDRPDPTRDWHNAINFATIPVVFFTLIVADVIQTPFTIGLFVTALITLPIAWFTSPFDPRYG